MPQFIYEQFIEDISLADKFVDHYVNNTDKHLKGKVADHSGSHFSDIKVSTEMSVEDEYESELSKTFCDELQIILNSYIESLI